MSAAIAGLRRIEAKLDRAIELGAIPLVPTQTRNTAGQFTTASAFTVKAARHVYGPNPQRELLKRALLAAIRRK